MKGNCGRYLYIRSVKIPSHDVKWARLMAVINVDLMGMKAASWKYLASSKFVFHSAECRCLGVEGNVSIIVEWGRSVLMGYSTDHWCGHAN